MKHNNRDYIEELHKKLNDDTMNSMIKQLDRDMEWDIPRPKQIRYSKQLEKVIKWNEETK